MGSSKYVGGVAVAVGVGAAIAAGQDTANADTGKPDSTATADSSQVDAGPKRSEARSTAHARPQSKLGDKVEGVSTRLAKAPASTLSSVVKPTAAAFEAAQVEKLQGLFAGSRRTAPTAAVTTDTTDTNVITDPAPSTKSATAEADATTPSVPWSPNPFRPMPPEPAPNDMPGAVWASQIVPWVNAAVPVTNIVPALIKAFQGERTGAQIAINQLLLTTPAVSLL
jgi:hypothetical protein